MLDTLIVGWRKKINLKSYLTLYYYFVLHAFLTYFGLNI